MNILATKVMDAIHLAGFVEIETSAKHVHLTQEDVEILFGKGAKLEFKRSLSQPGQFLAEQRVDIIGPKRKMEHVAVLGDVRSATQIELALSDCVALGMTAPLRESGDTKGSAPIVIEGPCGRLEVHEGAIVAHNHIHVTERDSKLLDLKDKDRVCVEVFSERPVIFEDVIIRVSSIFSCKMHVDVDEANAAGIQGFTLGRIIRNVDKHGIGKSINWKT